MFQLNLTEKGYRKQSSRTLWEGSIWKGSIWKGLEVFFILKYRQKRRKTNPKRQRKSFVFLRLFRLVFLLFYSYISINKKQFLPLQNGLFSQCERRLFSFSDIFNGNTSKRRRESKKEVCHDGNRTPKAGAATSPTTRRYRRALLVSFA